MSASLTRREFVAGAAALLAAPQVAAADAPLFSFALVTDTHLGKPGADYVKRMATAVAEINEAAVEFTVFCGDLVDRGEVEANQKRYAEWLEIACTLRDFLGPEPQKRRENERANPIMPSSRVSKSRRKGH